MSSRQYDIGDTAHNTDSVTGAPLARMEAFVAMAAHANPHDLLTATTRAMVQLFGDRGWCVLLDPQPRVVVSTETPPAGGWPIEIERYPGMRESLASGEVVAVEVEDVRLDGLLGNGGPLLSTERRSVTAIPLISGDKRVGVVFVQSNVTCPSSATDKNEALSIARVAAVLVDGRSGGHLSLIPSADPQASGRDSMADDGQAHPIPTAVLVPPTGRRNVLVVDDDDDQAEILRIALSQEGYEVRTAADGEACLRAVEETPPDLILMDVAMPGVDGTHVAERIRQPPLSCGASIIFVSGCSDLLPRMRHLGMADTDFLPKPYSIEQLLVRMERSFERLEAQKRLQDEAHVDDLTGLGNLRLLRERLATESSRMERYGTPATVVLVDVDKLKAINDQHGHPAGSEALRAIGAVLKAEIRETDLAVRYGGDEFVVLLPHTSLSDGLAFAERVLRSIRSRRPSGLLVTASIGVAARERKSRRSFESLLAHADVAVYRAKRAGGDRVSAFENTADEVSSVQDISLPSKSAV